MATYFINPAAVSNGVGTEGDPFNTFVGITWGANDYRIKRGTTLLETITVGSGGTNARIYDYGAGALPVIDCEGSRASGIIIGSVAGVEVFNLDIRNQNAAAPDAGVRITGSAYGGCSVHHCKLSGNRVAIHLNVSPRNRIYQNEIDCGYGGYTTSANGVRINGATSTGNRVYLNRIRGSAAHDHVDLIQCNAAPSNSVWGNELIATMADAISLFSGSDGCKVIGNLIYGTLMKDAIAVEDSDSPQVLNNTVIHPGDLDGHSGPCLKIGDNFGAGTAPTNAVVKNNVFYATNRIPMALDPIGTGAVFSNNCYFVTDGSVVVNLDKSGTLTPLTYANWLLEGLDSDSVNEDSLLDASYRPMAGSPCIGAGTYIPGARHMGGKRLKTTPDIGAYRYEPLRSLALNRAIS